MQSKTNFAFFGTPEFAAIILEKLIAASFVPRMVVCNPDKPVGRKKIVAFPPTKIIARKYGIKVHQPEKLEIQEFKAEIGEIDCAIVTAYSKILPKEILEIPRLGAIGVHPSLLPKYRGATPIQSAILNGESETGVTLFLMDEKVDHGPVIGNWKLVISNLETTETLTKKLANGGVDLLIETLPKFLAGEIKPQVQNETEATYTKKFKTEDGFVDLGKDEPEVIMRKIRALNPEPGTWTYITENLMPLIRANKGHIKKRMKILEAEITDGKIKLKKIQIEGKKPKKL